MRNVCPVFFAVMLLSGSVAFALENLTYQGRILKPDGTPVDSYPVTVTIQVRSPGAENCLLYQETHTLDMRGSGGVFSISIGGGTRASSSVDGGFPISKIFGNKSAAIGPLPNCDFGSSYTPNAADSRKLSVSFNDGSGAQTLQTQTMAAVPYAIETNQISGYTAESLLRVDGATAPAFNPAELGELQSLIAGSSGQYTKANELGGAALPALSSGESLRWNGSGWEPMTAGSVVNSVTAGTGLNVGAGPGGSITSTGTLNLADTGVAAGIYGDAANIPQLEVDAQGRLTSVTNIPLTTVANFSGALAGDVSGTQGATSVDRIKGVAVSSAAPLSGQVLRHDGSQWVPTVPNVADLKNAAGDLQLPTDCTESETPTFDSLNDKFICTPISVATFTGSLAGDVSGPANGTVVGAVGGVTAANVATGATLANDATPANTASAIVRRDASGNFAAGTVTATTFTGNLTGTATNTTQIQGQPVDPAAPATAGQTLVWDGAKYVAKNPKFQDLKTAAALTQFPTNCSTTQVMIYSSVSDTFECQNITLANTTDILGGDVTGSIASNTVTKLQNRDVASTAPGTSEVLKWNGSAWAPAPDVDSGGDITDVTAGTGLTGGGTTGAVSLAVAYGSAAGTSVQGNDARVGMGACGAGNKQRWTGSAWVCETDLGLTAEADTLATITARGASTSTNTAFNGTLSVGGTLALGSGVPLTMNGNTVIDANGGWLRTYGSTGWYNGTYAGGWYMVDTTWVRSYGDKNVYTGGTMQAATVSGTTVCVNGSCRTSWPSGGSCRLCYEYNIFTCLSWDGYGNCRNWGMQYYGDSCTSYSSEGTVSTALGGSQYYASKVRIQCQ